MNAVASERMPDWLAGQLIILGLADQATAVTRKARAVACRGCGQAIIRGLDAEWCAWEAECDPQPLSVLGEIQAILAGRSTRDMRPAYPLRGGRPTLGHVRDQFNIKGDPPGTRGLVVLADHKCGSTEQFDMAEAPPEIAAQELPDEPPF